MTSDNADPRIDYGKVAPLAIQAVSTVERYTHELKLERPLPEVVKLRASMINGCSYCSLYALSVWREGADHVADEVYRLAREHFERRELID
jgi:hypothetical protein